MARVVFFGSPEFAVPSLKAMSQTEFSPSLVVTQPDRPAGRGRESSPTPVRIYAESAGLKVRVVDDLKDGEALGALESEAPDYFVVAAFGLIFPKKVLDIPSKECVNLHASLLPAYRGASPVNAAVVNGDQFTGLSTMRMQAKLDAGPVFMQEVIPVGPDETAGELSSRLADSGAGLVLRTLRALEEGALEPVEQDDAKASTAARLRKKDGIVPWERGALAVHNHIRGMNPWPGSHSMIKGKYVKILGSRPEDVIERKARPGEVLGTSEDGILVACSPGAVMITTIQAGGKRAVPAADYARGARLGPGDIFSMEES